jgi:hypothetical protein
MGMGKIRTLCSRAIDIALDGVASCCVLAHKLPAFRASMVRIYMAKHHDGEAM